MSGFRAWVTVGVALAISAALFRPFVADALVSRGDEFLHSADLATARIYYLRAVRIDPRSETAAERLTFVGFRLGDPQTLRASIAFADAYVMKHPASRNVRYDRAFALWASGQDARAATEFLRLGRERRDFRLFGLAAHAALRSGRPRLARYAFARALAINPQYVAASRALRIPTP